MKQLTQIHFPIAQMAGLLILSESPLEGLKWNRAPVAVVSP